MSVLDFSSMFRSGKETVPEKLLQKRRFDERENMTLSALNEIESIDIIQTKRPKVTALGDIVLKKEEEYQEKEINKSEQNNRVWVVSQLRELGMELPACIDDLVINFFSQLLEERKQSSSTVNGISEECNNLRTLNSSLRRENERFQSQIEQLSQDIQTSQNRTSAMQIELRDAKAQWMAEKNDLETRCFQAQAQTTQIQGTLRKKEKDFEKLQNHLEKVVRDSSRKSSTLTISKPVPKKSSQAKPVPTIRDASRVADLRQIELLQNELQTYKNREDQDSSIQSSEEVNKLQVQLEEAKNKIKEQQDTIHQVVFCNQSIEEGKSIWDNLQLEQVTPVKGRRSHSSNISITPLVKSMEDSTIESLLPPASPETIELLKSYGWATLPPVKK